MIAHDLGMTDPAQVMVGIDGSPFGDDALRWAVEEGHLHHAEVIALLAWDYLHQLPAPGGPPFDPEYRQDVADAALQALIYRVLGVRGSSVTARAVFGLAAPVLLDQVRDASLLVVGARGLGRLRPAPRLGQPALRPPVSCPFGHRPQRAGSHREHRRRGGRVGDLGPRAGLGRHGGAPGPVPSDRAPCDRRPLEPSRDGGLRSCRPAGSERCP
jgi:nucleotide-binding universal stress UspA family protein